MNSSTSNIEAVANEICSSSCRAPARVVRLIKRGHVDAKMIQSKISYVLNLTPIRLKRDGEA